MNIRIKVLTVSLRLFPYKLSIEFLAGKVFQKYLGEDFSISCQAAVYLNNGPLNLQSSILNPTHSPIFNLSKIFRHKKVAAFQQQPPFELHSCTLL